MIYRPEQKSGDGKSYNAEEFWKRKQSPKHNRVCGEAEVHGPDRDAENLNYSYGKDGYERPKDKGPAKSSTIWDDEAWRDKAD